MVTWSDIGKNVVETAKAGGAAVKGVAGGFKDIAVGTGAAAGGAVGGAAGSANWVAKGTANTIVNIVKRGLNTIRKYPRISAFLVTIAAATGIVGWWEKRKVRHSQELEAMDLQASIAARRAARVDTSLQTGQSSPLPYHDDKYWQEQVKRGLPGQQLPK